MAAGGCTLLLNNVDDAVVVWDPNGIIRFWNQAAERLFGWPAAERLGQSAAECYLNTFAPAIQVDDLQPSAPEVERLAQRRCGSTVWLSSRVTTLYDSANHPQGYMDVLRDITQRKQLEAQIHAAHAQLAQAARLTAVGALAAGVAHHISNPLTTVIAEAQLLKLQPTPSELAESAAAIERAGWQAQAAVRRLIEFSEPSMVDFGPVSLADNLRAALDLVGAHVESLGVSVALEVPPGLPAIEGNARQLEDLWTNLLLLARAAIDDDQPQVIQVSAAASPAGEVSVRVTDHGRPIPAEVLPTLFDSAPAAQAAGRGTGLELSICQEIMRQHGGRLELASSPASGTTVTVIFPSRPSHDIPTR